MSFHYYTTADQEAALSKIYADAIAEKQAEIDAAERRTRKPTKFTAYAHVSKPPILFDVSGSQVTLEGYGPCQSTPTEGCGTYTTDPSFDEQIAAFLSRHAAYRVIFKPSGRYGPTIGYCSVGMPATFISEDGADTLHAEDEDKYDILCG
jgi:hypothetical protein